MINILILLSIFLLNSFAMETDFVTIDIHEPSLLKALKIKTDSDLINILPAEIWQLILANLDPTDKKTLKTVLYFFAPRVGVPKNLAKTIAVNLSNYAALKSVNMDDWKDIINNSYKNWGQLKNCNLQLAQNSQENIIEYLKIVDNYFLKKVSIYNNALVANDKREEVANFWKNMESEFARCLAVSDIDHAKIPMHWPGIFNRAQDDLKIIYLEIKKCLLLGKYQVISPKLQLAFALLVLSWPQLFWLTKINSSYDYTGTIVLNAMYYPPAFAIIAMFFPRTFVLSLKNRLSRRSRNYIEEYPVSKNLIHVETRLQSELKNSSKISTYESLILDRLNKALNKQEKNVPLIEFSDI